MQFKFHAETQGILLSKNFNCVLVQTGTTSKSLFALSTVCSNYALHCNWPELCHHCLAFFYPMPSPCPLACICFDGISIIFLSSIWGSLVVSSPFPLAGVLLMAMNIYGPNLQQKDFIRRVISSVAGNFLN